VVVWDPDSGTSVLQMTGHALGVTAVAVLASGVGPGICCPPRHPHALCTLVY
jgi:hypothetical protein